MNDNVDRVVNITLGIAVFVVVGLKIAGVIKTPWIWLLSPIWGLFLLGIALAIFLTIGCLIRIYIENKKEKRK